MSHQFRVDFDGNEYSVPWRLVRRIVTLRANEACVRIFVGNKRVAVHPRSWRKGESIVRVEHEEGLREHKPGAQQSADIQAIRDLGPYAARYVELLPAQTTSIRSELSRLMVLITVYGAKAMEEVVGKALAQGIVGAAHLERMLVRETAAEEKRPEPISLSDPRLKIVATVPDLKSYDAILMESESDTEREETDADADRSAEDLEA